MLSECKLLFKDFKRPAQLYATFAASLGAVLGVYDGPQEVKRETPRELGFWRQFILTTPAVALALRLGAKGRELQVSRSAIFLTVLPTLWAPLGLYLVGYPVGVEMSRYFETS